MIPDSAFTHTSRDSAVKFVTWRFSEIYMLIEECELNTVTYSSRRLIVDFCKEYKKQYRLQHYSNIQIAKRIKKIAVKNFDEIMWNAL